MLLLQIPALSAAWLFEKYISAQSSEANVDYIKNTHPVSSLPLLTRVITTVIKLQNKGVFFSIFVGFPQSCDTYTHDLIYFAFTDRPCCSRVELAPPSLFLLLFTV